MGAVDDLGIENIVPMPKTLWGDNGRHDSDKYEQIVDDYIQKNKLKENDVFRVDHPPEDAFSPGPNYYRYNGKDSGGRKDWMIIDKPKNPLVSQAARDLGVG